MRGAGARAARIRAGPAWTSGGRPYRFGDGAYCSSELVRYRIQADDGEPRLARGPRDPELVVRSGRVRGLRFDRRPNGS